MINRKATFLAFLASAVAFQICSVQATFSKECEFYWGPDRGDMTGPDSVELKLTKDGGTGIKSKDSYMYGAITMQIKLVSGNSAGTVTTFYLSSTGDKHDEIDFEFLGNSTREPYTIHTNIYTQGFGPREMQFKPWFDPTDGFHNYTIFWNPYEIVWMVDWIPIRVFRKYNDSEINYPDAQPMNAYSSLWNADDWATQGGRVKTDWSLAPFVASLQKYSANACRCPDQNSVAKCSSKTPANWWTNPKYSQLSKAQLYQMTWIQHKFRIYNYCNDTARFNGTFPKECSLPQY